jgi:Membrane protein involved in colicin uptake
MLPNAMGDNDWQGRSESTDPKINTDSLLVEWVTSRAKRAREARDMLYGDRWKEYTRLWRGFWKSEDKAYDSERSRLISPALSQAIEMTVSEIEEAVFGREAWFDIEDDLADEQKDDALVVRDNLMEDIDLSGAKDAMSRTFLLGAIYGTGITKIHVDLRQQKTINDQGDVSIDERLFVPLEAVRPDEFFIDPSATTIDEAEYCGHDIVKPKHVVEAKMLGSEPVYRFVDLHPYAGERGDSTGTGIAAKVDTRDNAVLITEFCGKIPAKYLPGGEGEEMVEAIVTIANDNDVLRAIPSPYKMKDRPFVSYQHDTVPGEFWGRGVTEKGYNPQKALDTELRARADALALITAPMMGADVTRLGRNPDLRVRPGKIFMMRGRPSEVMEPVGFNPQGLALTFQQSGDLERMVQMGTGAMDSATPLGTNRRNETASGMSMLQASFLKRAKRTMQNIERQYMNPLLRRMLWRYMQFDPARYPKDYKFVVRAAMGIMAKEVENAQLVSMLGYVPPESPAHGILLKALFDNTASAEKKELKAAIEAMLAPPSEEQQQQQQMMQQLQMQMAQLELAEKQATVTKLQAEAQYAQARALLAATQAEYVDDNVEIQAANAAIGAEQARISKAQLMVQNRKIDMDLEKERIKAKAKPKKAE